jgi:hypothetical protein
MRLRLDGLPATAHPPRAPPSWPTSPIWAAAPLFAASQALRRPDWWLCSRPGSILRAPPSTDLHSSVVSRAVPPPTKRSTSTATPATPSSARRPLPSPRTGSTGRRRTAGRGRSAPPVRPATYRSEAASRAGPFRSTAATIHPAWPRPARHRPPRRSPRLHRPLRHRHHLPRRRRSLVPQSPRCTQAAGLSLPVRPRLHQRARQRHLPCPPGMRYTVRKARASDAVRADRTVLTFTPAALTHRSPLASISTASRSRPNRRPPRRCRCPPLRRSPQSYPSIPPCNQRAHRSRHSSGWERSCCLWPGQE